MSYTLFQKIFVLNYTGLYSEMTSNGVLVDDSPPTFSRKPELFQQLGSMMDNSIIYRSCLKVSWEVSDEESYIERQYISLTSHRGGEINSTSTEVIHFRSCIQFRKIL